MSRGGKFYVECDTPNCYTYQEYQWADDARSMLERLTADGWCIVQGQDRCPACVEAYGTAPLPVDEAALRAEMMRIVCDGE